ncbi:MAG: hypothetical protein A2Y60_02380 [Chloroflexi bacterium RBG_13_54_9]|nr:MAG: hypothetical protein A2Y60_02380 [Chloroflexi bacterium RBG_13_54_9]
MISTVTTTVITVVTTVSSIYLATSLGLAAVITLIASLATKELVNATDGTRTRLLGRNLDIPIFALLFVFTFILIITVLEVLA